MSYVPDIKRGRRVLVYGYTGSAKIDTNKITNTQGIIIDKEGDTFLVYCAAVNRILTFLRQEIGIIWRHKETKLLKDYYENLYNCSQNNS
jgi:hypothetical protein